MSTCLSLLGAFVGISVVEYFSRVYLFVQRDYDSTLGHATEVFKDTFDLMC